MYLWNNIRIWNDFTHLSIYLRYRIQMCECLQPRFAHTLSTVSVVIHAIGDLGIGSASVQQPDLAQLEQTSYSFIYTCVHHPHLWLICGFTACSTSGLGSDSGWDTVIWGERKDQTFDPVLHKFLTETSWPNSNSPPHLVRCWAETVTCWEKTPWGKFITP